MEVYESTGPLTRRLLQGASVVTFYLILSTGSLFVFGALVFYGIYCFSHFLWPVPCLYLAWMYCVDLKTFNRGGRRSEFIRTIAFFRFMRDYFPVSLVKTAELDPSRNYIFGYHPHGIFPEGLAVSFGSEALHFSEIFPGIVPYLGVHSFIGWSPILRDIAMALGAVNVNQESCKFVLNHSGPGHSIAIAVGGASEVLNTNSNTYMLTLKRRRGFVKLALETGSPLVPVFGFGQNEVFLQPRIDILSSYNPGRSKWEKWSKVFMKGCMQVLFARFGIMPHAKPITVVVGKPIPVEKVENPTEEEVNTLHSTYIIKVIELFQDHREACGIHKDTELIIQ